MKTALVTGASSGLGKEFARIHAEKGGDLVLVARREDKLLEIKKDLEQRFSVSVKVVVQDLTVPKAVDNIIDFLQKENIEIEYLINNAGFGGVGVFHQRDWDADQKMIQLNVMALTELTRKMLPSMVKRNSGKILNISSVASLMPGPLQAVYFATKAYVTSLSNAIAEELSDTNITITTLMPNATATEFGKISEMDKTNLFRHTDSPDKVAKVGYRAMQRGKMNIIYGIGKVLPFFLSIVPRKLVLKYVKANQKIKS